ncbi:MAG: hypothetical protein EOP87_09160 [Verrucomicrobiaceae bacterium]|nr:MAG: hypothetical protein EOP87_09160 [Verrucomicrobiaceae bacterium]
MKSTLFTFPALIACCINATGSVLPAASLKEIFRKHSGLPEEKMTKATFQDFKFDIGTTKDARIIAAPRGGRSVIRWNEDERSVVSIDIFTQRLYENYSGSMDVPIDIIKSVSTEDSSAALDEGNLRNSWKVGKINGVGDFCVGELWGGMLRNRVTTGYFLDEEYGFCLWIGTLKENGIEAQNVEQIGKSMILEIRSVAKANGVIPNPLSKGGPLVVKKPKVLDNPGQDPSRKSGDEAQGK